MCVLEPHIQLLIELPIGLPIGLLIGLPIGLPIGLAIGLLNILDCSKQMRGTKCTSILLNPR